MVESVVIQSAVAGADDPNAVKSDAVVNQNANTPVVADGLPSDGGPKSGEPVKLAGKFDSPADLEKAYLELQSKLGKAPAAEPPKPAEGTPKAPDATIPADVAAAQDAVTAAGLNFDELSVEFAKDGKLADTSYEKLGKAGIPKAMVDSFIAGQQAIAEARAATVTATAHEAGGGAEEYAKMIQWAASNMDKDAKVAFNAAIEGGNPAAVKLAVAGLAASYTKAGAAEPSNITGGGKVGGSVYESTAQVMKDMGDPRYASDESFRKAVEAKLSRSNVL